jgi:hypothetical protein
LLLAASAKVSPIGLERSDWEIDDRKMWNTCGFVSMAWTPEPLMNGINSLMVHNIGVVDEHAIQISTNSGYLGLEGAFGCTDIMDGKATIDVVYPDRLGAKRKQRAAATYAPRSCELHRRPASSWETSNATATTVSPDEQTPTSGHA